MSSSRSLSGRTVLVTGGARRLGAEISRHLGACGARVLIHYRTSAGAARALAESLPGGARALHADLSQAGGAAALFAACDEAGEIVDAVVHGAASFERHPPLATSAAAWDRIFALNLRSFYLLACEFSRRRSEASGDLIALADTAAVELWTGYLAHSVAKAGLLALVRALAKALAPTIRVNAVVPGPVLAPAGVSQEELERMRERTLLKRLGEPRHVAQAVEFLLTCDYATGATIEVTGGSELWRGSTAGVDTRFPASVPKDERGLPDGDST